MLSHNKRDGKLPRVLSIVLMLLAVVMVSSSFLVIFSSGAHATAIKTAINTLNGWTVENGGVWTVTNSTFRLTTATSNPGMSFLVNVTDLPQNFIVNVTVELAGDYNVGIGIFYNLTNRIDFIASTYATSPAEGEFQAVKEVGGTRTYLNPAFGEKIQLNTVYYMSLMRVGTTYTFKAGSDPNNLTTVTATIIDAVFASNVHLAFFASAAGDNVTFISMKTLQASSQEFGEQGFDRLQVEPQHWYKIVPWQGEIDGVEYSYIAFYNGYNMDGAMNDTLRIDYLNSNFSVIKTIYGPQINGELYPMKLNGNIFLPGHDGTEAYFGVFDPSTQQVTGTDISSAKYITDMIYYAPKNEYFLMPAQTTSFFFESSADNIQNPASWQEISVPSQFTPNDAYLHEMRFTLFKHYLYFITATDHQPFTNSDNFLFRYDINNGTFEELAEIKGNNTDGFIRSDYNTITYAIVYENNTTCSADFYTSHDGVNFKKLFVATINITEYPLFEKHAYALPLLNSEYYYVELTGDGAQGKYFIIDDNGTVYYNATVTEAAHSTIADPIIETNRLIEGTEKWTAEYWPANGWDNNSYIQAMTFEKLPIEVSTTNNGGTPVQVSPDTVIYAIEPYNGTIGMFYKRFYTTETVYVNANGYTYHVGTIVVEHGGYVSIANETASSGDDNGTSGNDNGTGNNTNNNTNNNSTGGTGGTGNIEKAKSFLLQNIEIAGIKVPVWVLIAMVVIVIFAIAAVRR